MNQLILLEGPDFAGKTTWAGHLVTKWSDLKYFKAVADTTEADYRNAILSCVESTLLMDRCWLSEAVYGPILRKETFDENIWREQHRRLVNTLRQNNTQVLILYAGEVPYEELCHRYHRRGDTYLEEHAKVLGVTVEALLNTINALYASFFYDSQTWNIGNWPILNVNFLN